MRKIIYILAVFTCSICIAQTPVHINGKAQKKFIKVTEIHNYELNLKKELFYTIAVDQLGIDLVVSVKDKAGKILTEKDSPTGQAGTERVTFSPDSSGRYTICVKALDEPENARQGSYTIGVYNVPKGLKRYSLSQLHEDFDILKNAYVETRVGLWYSSYTEFDSICTLQRSKLRDKMTSLEFYKIVAPVTAFTREGHSAITVSDQVSDYFRQYGTYLPFFFKIIDRKVYVLNNSNNFTTEGLQVLKINNITADSLLQTFEDIEPSDGYNITSKPRWIESSFNKYFLRFFGNAAAYQIEFLNQKTQARFTYRLPALTYKQYLSFRKDFLERNPDHTYAKPLDFVIDSAASRAILTINDFGAGNYGGKKGFRKILNGTFSKLIQKNIKNLVIDIRKNEGGNQGVEDILLSYLINKQYLKYKYVEIPSFTYSFLKYTDYKGEADIFKKKLSEFERIKDGRYLNKIGYYEGLRPDSLHFKGNLAILIGGLTFSGGSEFAALAKNYTNAIFVGEETGGGYYGNTSGIFLNFTLPNTEVTGRIPLCKFVVETNYNAVPFGHGLIPDYIKRPTIDDYLNKTDVELNFTKKLLEKK